MKSETSGTGLVYDDRFLLHKAPYEHPENPARLKAIHDFLGREGLIARCEKVPAREAKSEELAAIHTPGLIEGVRATAARDFTQFDPDTYACRESAAAAWLAAGGL
ncbi:MAG TPA: histone deacetylase, partial [Thermoanaerobaculia bacterium]|nr:histone deacetylase [Thermoanaerobaculia bacterium]